MTGRLVIKPGRLRAALPAALAFVVLQCLALPAAQAQQPAKWSVPARVFSAGQIEAKPVSAEMPQVTTAPPAAASPLPPAYQTSSRVHGADEPRPDDAGIRFVVPLVERPIVVEAKIIVDGKPFRMLREARIDALLNELSQPAAVAKATDADSSEEVPEAAAAEGDRPEPTTPPPMDNSIVARLRRYAEATQRPPSRDEVRWLLSTWTVGPALLVLDPNFQRVRADAAPLFKVLDRDEDGVLSAVEIDEAERSLWKYDGNQDEALSLAEITKGAQRTPDSAGHSQVAPPLTPIEELASAATFGRLCQSYNDKLPRFDRDADGRVSSEELTQLLKSPADIALVAAFDTQNPDRSKLEAMPNDVALVGGKPIVRQTSLSLLIGRTWLELSIVQSGSGDAADQISIGAVRDGYPLLPEIDADEDGRLTVRELRQVSQRLKAFDGDGDGAIAQTELLPTIRLSLGLGPIVHRQLETVRSFYPPSQAPSVAPPEWFARMDRNNDLDLTPREFLGAKDQFAALDADGDGLISALEASQGKE